MRKWVSALAVIALAMAAGCDRPASPATTRDPAPPAVVVIHPQHGEVTRTITLPGDIVGFYEATLFSKVTGYLKSIGVDKGDRVKAGQVLAVIEVPELAQQLDRAKANLEIQRVTYNRLEEVWKSDPRLVARQDVDVAFSKYQQARAEVNELEAMESYTRIVAPFDGVITGRFVDPGALIKAGGSAGGISDAEQEGSAHPNGGSTPVVSEAMIDKLRIYVYVPQDEVPRIKRGMAASVTLADEPGKDFPGTVTRFAESLDLSTRTMLTEVDLENPEHKLYPGMYANVMLQLEHHDNALKLPAQTLESTAEGAFVYVVRDGRLSKVPVTPGITNGRTVEIISGLTGDEEVVNTYTPALVAGEKVTPVMLRASSDDSGRAAE